MENEFVPYELALRLKNLGFIEECFGRYGEIDNLEFRLFKEPKSFDYGINSKTCLAPMFSQAFTWIYDNYQENNDILVAFLDMTAFNVLYDKYRRLECLKNLIEIIEQKN